VESPDQSPVEHGFRMRGATMSRIDVFSDVIFGFALVLLVVSLVVPDNSGKLRSVIPTFVPFAISFVMILGVWYSHYVFFRRYGLHDRVTIVLNSVLLFLLLFCVYPLKFLFTGISAYLFRDSAANWFATTVQINGMLVLYALGFAALFFLVAALYWNAWRRRDSLALNGIERLLTVSSMVDALGLIAIALLACLASLVIPSAWSAYSAAIYLLIAPWKLLNTLYFGRKASTLQKLVAAPTL
jgi:uncharacterized membrane protein